MRIDLIDEIPIESIIPLDCAFYETSLALIINVDNATILGKVEAHDAVLTINLGVLMDKEDASRDCVVVGESAIIVKLL